MKVSTGLLYVFVTIALVKPSTGNVARDAPSVAAAPECDIEAEEGESTYDHLRGRTEQCAQNLAHYELKGNGPTAEDIRAITRDFCGKRAELKRCFDEVRSKAEACSLNETERTGFRLFQQEQELEHEVGCVRNGEDMEYINVAIISMGNYLIEDCVVNATAAVDKADAQDPNGYMVHKYRVLEKQRECIEGRKGEGHDLMIAKIISMYIQIMDRMKCDQNGTDVLCKTIVNNH